MIYQDPTFWVFVAFLIFLFLFGKKIFFILISFLDARIQEIEKRMNDAKITAEEAHLSYIKQEQELKDTERYISDLYDRTQKEIVFLKNEAEEKLEKKVLLKKDQVKQRIRLYETQAALKLRQDHTDAVFRTIYTVLHLTQKEKNLIIEQAFKKFPTLSKKIA